MYCYVLCFHSIGTAGLAVQVVGSNWPKPHYTLLITGLCRFRVTQLIKERPFPVAEVEQLDKLEQYTDGDQADAELGELSQRFYQAAVQVRLLIPTNTDGHLGVMCYLYNVLLVKWQLTVRSSYEFYRYVCSLLMPFYHFSYRNTLCFVVMVKLYFDFCLVVQPKSSKSYNSF